MPKFSSAVNKMKQITVFTINSRIFSIFKSLENILILTEYRFENILCSHLYLWVRKKEGYGNEETLKKISFYDKIKLICF